MKVLLLLLLLYTLAILHLPTTNGQNQCNDLCSGATPIRVPNDNFTIPDNLTCPVPPWEVFPSAPGANLTVNFQDPNYLAFLSSFDIEPCCVQQSLCYWNCATTKNYCDNLFMNVLLAIVSTFYKNPTIHNV